MNGTLRSLFYLLLIVCVTAVAHGTEPADLTTGIKAYRDANYPQAVKILKALDPRSLAVQEQVLLFKFLGLSLIARNDKAGAEEAFTELLKVNAIYPLPESEFSPEVVKCFKRAKAALGNQLSDGGLEKYRAKNYAEAATLFRRAGEVDPSNPIVKDFLALAEQAAQAEQPKPPEKPSCQPSLDWGKVDTSRGQCRGADVSSAFKLPIRANKITLVYAVHHGGVGNCWKIVLYDAKGEVIHSFEDPEHKFASEKEPDSAARWQVVELPEVQTVFKIVMHSTPSSSLKRIISPDVGKNLLDTFLLSFEVACK